MPDATSPGSEPAADRSDGAVELTGAETGGDPSEQSEHEIETAFAKTVEEGARRLDRSTPALLATGFVGGADVSIGVFALLIVLDLTESKVLGSLAFSIGFIALTLARSELFTENFLVPIAAMLARPEHGIRKILRLWGGTAVANLIGGWVVAAIVVSGFPLVRDTGVDLGEHFVEIGIGWRSFAMAMLGGVIITVMTWMIEGTSSAGSKIVAAVVSGFLLTAGEINHCIVASLEMFVGLIAGAPYTYLDWLSMFAWSALGNVVGGIGLVTILRFVQVGGEGLRRSKAQMAGESARDVLLND